MPVRVPYAGAPAGSRLLIGILGALLIAAFGFQSAQSEPRPALARLADQMQNLNFFLPIAFGILMADRLPRERRQGAG